MLKFAIFSSISSYILSITKLIIGYLQIGQFHFMWLNYAIRFKKLIKQKHYLCKQYYPLTGIFIKLNVYTHLRLTFNILIFISS